MTQKQINTTKEITPELHTLLQNPKTYCFQAQDLASGAHILTLTGTGAVVFNKLFHLFLCMQNTDNTTSAPHGAFCKALLLYNSSEVFNWWCYRGSKHLCQHKIFISLLLWNRIASARTFLPYARNAFYCCWKYRNKTSPTEAQYISFLTISPSQGTNNFPLVVLQLIFSGAFLVAANKRPIKPQISILSCNCLLN